MKRARLQPVIQLFVCTNSRDASDPLCTGCGASGPSVYQALKREVAHEGRAGDVWVTRTLCLGQCPPTGCTVAIQPENTHWVGVTESDANTLLRHALSRTRGP